MSSDVFVLGVGMTPFAKHTDATVKSLTRDAVLGALKDANIRVTDIEAAYFSNATQGLLEGQHLIRGQIALRPLGLQGIPIINVENACASASTAFALAVQTVRSGEAEVALAIGVDKMIGSDKSKTFEIFDGCWEVATADENERVLASLGEGVVPPPNTISEFPYSRFMDVYAAWGRFHMREFGSTQNQFAAIAAKNHQHSVHNELAQYRVPYTVEEVLGARPISYPLTLPMCAPVSDGAAAAIVCSPSYLARQSGGKKRGVRVRATVMQTGIERSPLDVDKHLTRLAAQTAYERAGVGPEDISVVECHDATAIGELIQTENLGFCDFGEGGLLAEQGETTIGGRIPFNPSGGLESKGHPIGATGLGQVFELVTQLRGEAGPRQVPGARMALAENGGGLYGIEEATCCITILESPA
tara:strand:- start:303 stop:1550 length:1248 start_codon:yes stop_codon:yes gene_type:complete